MAIKHLTPQSKWKIFYHKVKDWIIKIFSRKKKDQFFLPLVQQVAARTIGLDLVSVKPMSGPTGIISYLDYCYGAPPVDSSVYTRWPEPDLPSQENII